MKEFFEKIKIYVEVFSYLIIGMGGLFITYFQYRVSEQDLLINKSEVLPLIRIKSEKIYDDSKKLYVTESLSFHNDGGPVKDFQASIKTYWIINKNLNGKRSKYCIYIKDFFDELSYTGNYKEDILECYSYYNYKKIKDIEVYSNTIYKPDEISFSKEIIVTVEFKDILNINHKEYFKSNNKSRYTKISEENTQLIKNQNNNFEVFLSNLTIDYFRTIVEI